MWGRVNRRTKRTGWSAYQNVKSTRTTVTRPRPRPRSHQQTPPAPGPAVERRPGNGHGINIVDICQTYFNHFLTPFDTVSTCMGRRLIKWTVDSRQSRAPPPVCCPIRTGPECNAQIKAEKLRRVTKNANDKRRKRKKELKNIYIQQKWSATAKQRTFWPTFVLTPPKPRLSPFCNPCPLPGAWRMVNEPSCQSN